MNSLWRKGKLEMAKYYDLKLKKSTDIKSLLLGLVITLIIILPVALIIINFIELMFYNIIARYILMFLSWALLMLCNGLSNLITIKIAKFYYSDNPNLTSLDEKAIFVYQTFNIGFGIFTLFIILYLGVI